MPFFVLSCQASSRPCPRLGCRRALVLGDRRSLPCFAAFGFARWSRVVPFAIVVAEVLPCREAEEVVGRVVEVLDREDEPDEDEPDEDEPDDGAELDEGPAEVEDDAADGEGEGEDGAEDGAGADGVENVLCGAGCGWWCTTVFTAMPPAAAAAVAPAASATFVAKLAAASRRAIREVCRCGVGANGDGVAGTDCSDRADRYACSAASTPRSSSDEPGARAASSNLFTCPSPPSPSCAAGRPSKSSALPSRVLRRRRLMTPVPCARPRACGATSSTRGAPTRVPRPGSCRRSPRSRARPGRRSRGAG